MSPLFAYLLLGGNLLLLAMLALIWNTLRRPADTSLERALREELRSARDETARQARELREEVASAQIKATEMLVSTVNTLGDNQKNLLDRLTQATSTAGTQMRAEIEQLILRNGEGLKEVQTTTDIKLEKVRATTDERFERIRLTLDEKLRGMGENQQKHLGEVVTALQSVERSLRQEQEKAREALDLKFRQIQESNEKKLDQMRQTVDEKLHSTLEKRLGESFKLVSERLEAVQRGLGEMQTLANGVGDLKRVLSNVKERGTWGEYQLGAILAEILTPEQYAQNVRVKDGRESVEFAIKLPGRSDQHDNPVWLPIDSKFPKEAYERLVEASTIADAQGTQQAAAELCRAVTKMARDIQEKYINPPVSTDFAILFLPTEGLFAEVLRQPGLHDELQQKHRVLVAGPTTLSAILNSLRVGFQTLVIEKRASEVWTVLGAVKTEFGKFGDVLEKVKKQIHTVSNTLDESSRRTRVMERKLRSVEELPADQTSVVLALSASADDEVEEQPSL
ncbi:protein of unknown function DUF195 [Desulfurispirillum indicum S5]|uniref:RmuC-domain protein n=1 Tax=Desulfurispirillum indicum (strain ATCC BAA-1389 / DSM 22839 / S5) TaxID=653733 RepID=E6W6R2_DESIS|nr:DNA recombination protein RmuC [Desulfurispirillum indicum]ADU65062.1 protein of unknown function DUF195 [Desulfurispirillum indicum S5]